MAEEAPKVKGLLLEKKNCMFHIYTLKFKTLQRCFCSVMKINKMLSFSSNKFLSWVILYHPYAVIKPPTV